MITFIIIFYYEKKTSSKNSILLVMSKPRTSTSKLLERLSVLLNKLTLETWVSLSLRRHSLFHYSNIHSSLQTPLERKSNIGGYFRYKLLKLLMCDSILYTYV